MGKKVEKLSEQMSICRLELMAALLAAKIEAPFKMRLFSDLQFTLHRLKNNHAIYRPFVSNHLK